MSSSRTDLRVEVVQGRPPMVKFAGQVDFRNRQLMCEAFDGLFAHGHTIIAADLSDVEYMDSSGISGLTKSAAHAIDIGGSIELVGVSAQICRVLTLCGAAVFFRSDLPDMPGSHGSETDLSSPGCWHVSDFQIPASPEAVASARARIADVVQSLPVSATERADVLISVGEALANAVRHGCKCCSTKTVTVKCVASPTRLAIDVTDPGPGFDPDLIPPPSPKTLTSGGMGIYMMRSLMDEVIYTFNGHTTVRLVKLLRGTTDNVPEDANIFW